MGPPPTGAGLDSRGRVVAFVPIHCKRHAALGRVRGFLTGRSRDPWPANRPASSLLGGGADPVDVERVAAVMGIPAALPINLQGD